MRFPAILSNYNGMTAYICRRFIPTTVLLANLVTDHVEQSVGCMRVCLSERINLYSARCFILTVNRPSSKVKVVTKCLGYGYGYRLIEKQKFTWENQWMKSIPVLETVNK